MTIARGAGRSLVGLLALMVFGSAASCKDCLDFNPSGRSQGTKDGSDVETLQRLVSLPYLPSKVLWNMEVMPGGNDLSVTALMWFQPAQVAEIVSRSRKVKEGPIEVWRPFASWFPESLRRQFTQGGADHQGKSDYLTIEALTIEPSLFIKNSLIHGDADVFEKVGLVYLGLYTM